jgi:hypothetical protein
MSEPGESLSAPEYSLPLRDLIAADGSKIEQTLADIATNGFDALDNRLYDWDHPVSQLAYATSYMRHDRESDAQGEASYMFGFLSAVKVVQSLGLKVPLERLDPIDMLPMLDRDYGQAQEELGELVAKYLADSQVYTGQATLLLEEVAAMRCVDRSLARLGWGSCLATVELHHERNISDQLEAAFGDKFDGFLGEVAVYLAQQNKPKAT